jgi:hypothetical protein
MAKFYGLRQTKSGSVIYRTHWWKFWGKIFLPTLLLVIALVFTMLKVVGLFPSIPPVQAYGGAIIFTLAAWGWWLYQYFDWIYIYILTADQLVMLTQALARRNGAPRQSRHPHRAVLNVKDCGD